MRESTSTDGIEGSFTFLNSDIVRRSLMRSECLSRLLHFAEVY